MWGHVGRRAPQPHQGQENCDREGRSTARCGRAAEGHGCQGWEERGGPSGQSSPVGGNVTWRFFFFFVVFFIKLRTFPPPTRFLCSETFRHR